MKARTSNEPCCNERRSYANGGAVPGVEKRRDFDFGNGVRAKPYGSHPSIEKCARRTTDEG